ncbi:MAG: hypothetical protein JNM62_09970 [Flavobacteriales bacterium]|nr:hypothetical protein [Flavobacteriales bacterium]
MRATTLRPFLFIVSIAAISVACKKDQRGGVPLNVVDISINVNNPAYADLAVPGGWLYLSGGSMGLIVYRSSPTDFVALDRHCPYQPENMCRLIVDESEITARDTACCHSAYLITNGSVTEGPAALSLQQYNTSFNGTTLRIYN